MPQSLTGDSTINTRSVTGIFQNLKTNKIIVRGKELETIIDDKLLCTKNVIDQLFITSDCIVLGLTDDFKDMICDAVNNYCPYYCNNPNMKVLQNNFNSSDNSISFFHEEVLDNDTFSVDLLSPNNLVKHENTNYLNFLTTNIVNDEYLENNNLKIFSLGHINKGKWLLNGNISVEIPKFVSLKNLKIYIYLDENIVKGGEIDLGSHIKTNEIYIKSNPFNLMFENDTEGKELKIGLISNGNLSNIKLNKTTNFFANLM